MERKRTLLILTCVLMLALGSFAAVAVAGQADDPPPPATTDTTPATDPGTSTSPTTDTTPTDPGTTTTDPGTTTTDPGTTSTDTTGTTGTTPAGTTGAGTTTQDVGDTGGASGSNGGTVQQGSDQGNLQPPGGGTGTVANPPTCQTNPGSSCGNNAATQIAVVSQSCNADSTVQLNLTITNAAGGAAQHVTVDAPVQCNNIAQITQIVRQYCLNCTLVVNQYQVTNNSSSTSTTVIQAPQYAAYCMPTDKPIMRGDGTVGWLVFLPPVQAQSDPLYTGATRANFDPAHGFVCDGVAAPALAATFTLTVPASLIGQFINLCLQPSQANAKPLCHSIKIDNAATVTIPVTSNIAATVSKTPISKSKSRAQISAASKSFVKSKQRCTTKTSVKVKAGKKTKVRISSCKASANVKAKVRAKASAKVTIKAKAVKR